MIFVAAGTEDGRKLAAGILSEGYPVTSSVVSRYGRELLEKYPGMLINDKPLDEKGLVDYIRDNKVRLFVDASHPYAANVSENAMSAARRTGIPYIRYERESVPVDYDMAFFVKSYEEAAKEAAKFDGSVFLTTGSKNVGVFVNSPQLKGREIIARVLPTANVLNEMSKLGLSPKNIIAMQGPFSKELNIALFRQYKTGVIVTKNSGEIGGADTKLEAARELRLPVVMIDRPAVNYPNIASTFEEILNFIKMNYKE